MSSFWLYEHIDKWLSYMRRQNAFKKTAWEVKSLSHKKSLFFVLTVLLLLAPFVCCGIRLNQTLPDKLAVVKDSDCNIKIGKLVSSRLASFDDVFAVNAAQNTFTKEEDGNLKLFTETVGHYDVELKAFGVFPIKTMSVDVIENDTLIPCGDVIGIKIHTDGVLVVKLASVKTLGGEKKNPARDGGIKEGDIITKVADEKVKNSDHFSELINKNGGKSVELEIIRENQTLKIALTPQESEGHYKIGAWIRDSTAGIGTMTFVDPKSGAFGSLGHGISDADTSLLLSVAQGSITKCGISSVKCSQRGSPGELHGVFASNDIGIIKKNSYAGIYGFCDMEQFSQNKAVKIATRFEVKTGAAKIIATVDENGPKEYDIQIEKVMTNSGDEKGMIIKVTDERLLEKTGGIVQGMSGSPILQNDKIVGAVTHVFVNEPTRGYGIFIELMMDEAQMLGAGE